MFGLKRIAVVLFVTAAIILAGCLGLGQTQQSSMETVSKGSGGLSYTGVVPAPASAPAVRIAGDQSTGTTNADQGVDTKIIKTGQVTIEVPQVPAAIDRVRDIAVSNGGYLSSSSIDTSQNDRKTGYAAIRIPAEKFDSVMQALAPLGKVISSSEQRSDVTEQYVDLTIQNKSYHTQLENYYRLMAKADKVEDIIKIQAQIDLSTINVNLQEPEPVGGETGHSFVTAINAGIGGFFAFIDTVIFLFLTFLIPILAAIIIYVAYWWQKKQKGAAAPPAEVKKEG
jgi:hypothetical protein